MNWFLGTVATDVFYSKKKPKKKNNFKFPKAKELKEKELLCQIFRGHRRYDLFCGRAASATPVLVLAQSGVTRVCSFAQHLG